MRRFGILLLLLFVVMGGCFSLPPRPDEEPDETTLTGDRVELPTVFFRGRPFVELKINGQGPYRFLVDTGSAVMCITPVVAQEARIAAPRYSAPLTGSNGAVDISPIVLVDRVEAPSFSLRGLGAFILTPDTATKLGAHVDKNYGGLIGMRAFQNVLLEIDYPQKKVSVIWPGKIQLPQAEGIRYTETVPHLTLATPSAKHPTLIASLDTGSTQGFALTDITSYPLRVGLIKQDGYFTGIGSLWRPLVGQLSGDMRLGPATWRDPKIYESREDRLGSDALAPWKLVIDQKAKMIWLLNGQQTSTTTWTGPLEPDGRPAVYGYAALPDGDGMIVKEVDPGSRAEQAGLKVGDRASWVESPTESAAPNANRVRLHVVRGSESLEILMSIADVSPPRINAAGPTP